MKLAILVFALSFNAAAGIFPTKIERLTKRFFVKKLDVQTKVVINQEVIDSKDECIKEQLKSWIKEYKEMDGNLQGEVKSFFAHLDQVNLNKPVITGVLSNTNYDLRFERCYYVHAGRGGARRECDTYVKQIGKDPEVMSGNLPSSKIPMINMKLDLNLQYMNQNIRTITMNTGSARIYREINSMDSEAYKFYLKTGGVRLWSDRTQVIPRCDLKTLRSIIDMH